MISNEARAEGRSGWWTALAASASLLVLGIGVVSLPDAADAAEKKKRHRVDLTALPLGDGKVISSGPRRGYLLSCQTSFTGGGATAVGPWIHGGTYDLTAKYTVDGAVSWPESSSVSIGGAGVTIIGNGLPDHPTGIFPISRLDDAYAIDRNPNSIAPYALNKTVDGSPAKTGVQCVGGTIGIAKNGIPIFNAVDAGGRDAVAHEVQDACSGHPQASDVYHYHGLPACISTGNKKKRSGLLGWALDGFPIYGPRGEGGEYLTNKQLDICHGIKSEVKYRGKLRRRYHYVANHEFPYTVGCYRGTPTTGNIGPPGQGGPPAP
ncbi:MAG: YHYH protein [Solirubrobacterales bacterium]